MEQIRKDITERKIDRKRFCCRHTNRQTERRQKDSQTNNEMKGQIKENERGGGTNLKKLRKVV